MEDDPLIGRQISNYRIERLIGRGGMASVYYGWDAKLRRPVAVKVADVQQQDVAYARRLVREARMMARWHHEHVIQVYYADQQGSLYFFAMEYVGGLDLGALMARYARAGELIPHADVVRIGRAVADALDYAHAEGVIHRDVKPSNVLLSLDGRIILSDFGLALEIQQGTMGEVLGTPHYLAPEQARDSASTVPQSDLYSLGVILFEMLTGNVPFDDPSPMSLALKHISEAPPLPTEFNPAISIPVEAVLLKALSKAPEDRYPSGAAMMDALEQALSLAPAGAADMRLRSPVAGVLDEIARAQDTQARHPEESAQPVTAMAQKAAPMRRSSLVMAVAGIAIAVVAIGTLGAVLLSGLVRGTQSAASQTTESTQSIVARTAPPPPATGQPLAQAPTMAPGAESATDTGQTPAMVTSEPTQPPPSGLEPTILYPGGRQMTLFTTERGFYLFNSGSSNVEIAPLAFEALDSASSAVTGSRFESAAWTEHYPMVEVGKCDAIEFRLTSAYVLRPPECVSFNALITPESASSDWFWLPRPDTAQFRIVWDGQEIARCPTGSGSCQVYLP